MNTNSQTLHQIFCKTNMFYFVIICLLFLACKENNKIKTIILVIFFLFSIIMHSGSLPIDQDGFVDMSIWDGVDKTGSVDVTNNLINIFSKGGDIKIPTGKYLIDYKGDDTGGVNVNIKINTTIRCDPNVIFIANNVDNDMMRFNIAPNLKFEWYGGMFYQAKQKRSLVVPFSTDYPSTNQGKTNTSDALTIYASGGDLSSCIIDGLTCYGADNTNKNDNQVFWLNSGGDGGLFIDNSQNIIVRNCKFVGSRDCGVYTSKKSINTLIENNKFINCFHGAACKRGATNVIIKNNYFNNCVRGISISYIPEFDKARNIIITNNSGKKCNIFIHIQNTDGFLVSDNKFISLGSTLPDETIIKAPNAAYGIDIDNSSNGQIENNSVNGITTNLDKSLLKLTIKLFRIFNGSSNNTFINNKSFRLNIFPLTNNEQKLLKDFNNIFI